MRYDEINKVVLVGCGNVGMSYAFSIVNGASHVHELVLIDVNKQKAEGEALDLMHAASCSKHKINVKFGDYSECNNADIVCIAAGTSPKNSKSRMDFIDSSIDIFKSIIAEINKTKFAGIYLIATNPLDIMTYVTMQLSGFPKERVIGSGTTLDTARLRCLVGEEVNLNYKNIHAYVIGEHGDSEMIPWSNATIGLTPISRYLTKTKMNKILKDVRTSAYKIIEKKGNTAYGIGMCLKNITDAIFENSNSIFTVSVYNEKYGVCIGQPAVICRNGVRETIDLCLSTEERKEFNNSVKTIKNVVKNLKLK